MRSDERSRDLTRREAAGRRPGGRRGPGPRRRRRRGRRRPAALRPVQDGPPELLAPRLRHDGKPDLDKALAATKELGLHYWESYPAHIPTPDPDEAAEYKKQARRGRA